MPYFRWIIVAFGIGALFLTIIGNSVFLITIWKTKSLNTASNTFFVFLSIIDLIAGLTCQPLFIVLVLSLGNERSYLVTNYNIIYSAICINSLLCVTLISINRLFAVICPITYRTFSSRKRSVRITSTALIFLSITSIIKLLLKKQKVVLFLVYFVIHILFLILILAAHCGLIVAMKRRKRTLSLLSTEERQLSKITCRMQRKTTRSISLFTLVFLLCFITYLAYQINHLLYFTDRN